MFLLPNNIAQKTFVLETCPEKKTNFSSLAREEEGFVFCHFSVLQKTKLDSTTSVFILVYCDKWQFFSPDRFGWERKWKHSLNDDEFIFNNKR